MENKRKEKKNKKHKGKIMGEQGLALSYVRDWVFRDSSDDDADQGFLPAVARKITDSVVFELHCHSNRSDGFLSPVALVERAHRNGVRFLTVPFWSPCCIKMNSFDSFCIVFFSPFFALWVVDLIVGLVKYFHVKDAFFSRLWWFSVARLLLYRRSISSGNHILVFVIMFQQGLVKCQLSHNSLEV